MTPAAVVEPRRYPSLHLVRPRHRIGIRGRSAKRTDPPRPSLWTGAVAPLASRGAVDAGALEIVQNAARDRLCITREPGWLAAFVQRAWSIIDPDPLVWNWHYTLLCLELERIADGRTRELVISIPPGCGKSILMALFSAALWLRNPGLKILALAHIDKNVTRDSKRHRDVIRSAWYRGLVEQLAREEGVGLVEQDDGTIAPWTLAADQNEKRNFENTAHGSREIGTVGGGITGTRCGGLIVDDAYDAKEATDGTPAQVAERMAFVVGEYDSNWLNRVHPIYGWRVVIMQGLAEGDLADVLVRRGVRCVILPMLADRETTVDVAPLDGSKPYTKPMCHPRDPRAPGALLFPWLYSAEWCARMRATAGGARIWGPQYQQIRSRLGGALFPRAYFAIPAQPGGAQRYRGRPEAIAKGMDGIGISVDCTFGRGVGRDRVALAGFGWRAADRFVLDVVAEQMDITETMAAILNMRAKLGAWAPGKLRWVLLEKAANGEAVKDLMGRRVPGLILYPVKGGKFARAQISADAYQAGNVWLPDPEVCPWAATWAERHIAFTGEDGGEDDEVDAESQFHIFLNDEDAKRPGDALQRARDMNAMFRP